MKTAHQTVPNPVDSLDVANKAYADSIGGGSGVVLTGTGSPEGVEVAAVGTIFQQTDGAPGSVAWIKESGTGNTGWTPIDLRFLISGTGSPEGVWIAPIGTLFARTDGTTDTAFYVKETGAGNTGWVAFALSDVVRTGDNPAYTDVANVFSEAQRTTIDTLTWGANVSIDAAGSNAYELTLAGATAQLDNPSNLADGQSFVLFVVQGPGAQALTFDTAYDWGTDGAPDFTTDAAGEMTVITGLVRNSKVFCEVSRRGYVA